MVPLSDYAQVASRPFALYDLMVPKAQRFDHNAVKTTGESAWRSYAG